MSMSNFDHVCPRCGHISTGKGQVLWALGEEVKVIRYAPVPEGVRAHRVHGTGWRGPDGHQCGEGFVDDDLTRALGPCED